MCVCTVFIISTYKEMQSTTVNKGEYAQVDGKIAVGLGIKKNLNSSEIR